MCLYRRAYDVEQALSFILIKIIHSCISGLTKKRSDSDLNEIHDNVPLKDIV